MRDDQRLPIGELELRPSTEADREWIHRLRHEVYARELGQHAPNAGGLLSDDLDESNVYLVALRAGEPAGFISVTPPWAGRYSIDKYLLREEHPALREDGLFELRILAVDPGSRGGLVGKLLMYAALRWVASHGGRTIVALGRVELLPMYLALGLVATDTAVRSGTVEYRLLTGDVAALTARTLRQYGPLLRDLRRTVRWGLAAPFVPDDESCAHGGASVEALGRRFDTLDAHRDVVPADVLDAWFPPSPAAIAALAGGLDWIARTSPPVRAGGLGAAQLVERCRRHGVFLRDLSPMAPTFEGRTVRIAVRDAAANARVAGAVAEALRVPLGVA